MTTAHARAKTPSGSYRLPDPPPRHPDDMTSFKHLALAYTGNALDLALHLGHPDTTIVTGERYLVAAGPTPGMAGSHYPDLLIAFDVDPALHEARNGYIVAEQGKPPDFVLEIASPRTGHLDVGTKWEDYQALGVREYWRFDETGRHHGARLAGDRLVDGRYAPIEIAELSEATLQGYSPALNLHLQWDNGQLRWRDQDAGNHIATHQSERAARLAAERARDQAETRARKEQAARHAAEAQIRQLQAELERLRQS